MDDRAGKLLEAPTVRVPPVITNDIERFCALLQIDLPIRLPVETGRLGLPRRAPEGGELIFGWSLYEEAGLRPMVRGIFHSTWRCKDGRYISPPPCPTIKDQRATLYARDLHHSHSADNASIFSAIRFDPVEGYIYMHSKDWQHVWIDRVERLQ